MSLDDFEHEPRSRNTYLHKLNSDLNHKKIKTKLNLIFLFVPSQLFVPLHGAHKDPLYKWILMGWDITMCCILQLLHTH